MAKRGRKSASELQSAVLPGPIEVVPRPDAPYELTDEEAIEWRAIVNRLPAGWFAREQWPLLVQYCRLIVTARRTAQLIYYQAHGDEPLHHGLFLKLTRAQREESAAIASLATKMRLSHQSTRSARADKGIDLPKPWLAGVADE
jgi:hypothetical protein